jgi:hypothetical protein
MAVFDREICRLLLLQEHGTVEDLVFQEAGEVVLGLNFQAVVVGDFSGVEVLHGSRQVVVPCLDESFQGNGAQENTLLKTNKVVRENLVLSQQLHHQLIDDRDLQFGQKVADQRWTSERVQMQVGDVEIQSQALQSGVEALAQEGGSQVAEALDGVESQILAAEVIRQQSVESGVVEGGAGAFVVLQVCQGRSEGQVVGQAVQEVEDLGHDGVLQVAAQVQQQYLGVVQLGAYQALGGVAGEFGRSRSLNLVAEVLGWLEGGRILILNALPVGFKVEDGDVEGQGEVGRFASPGLLAQEDELVDAIDGDGKAEFLVVEDLQLSGLNFEFGLRLGDIEGGHGSCE